MLARLFFGALENGARLLGLVGAARRCLVCREAILWGLPPFFLLPKDVAPTSRAKVAPKSHQSWISREKSNFDANLMQFWKESCPKDVDPSGKRATMLRGRALRSSYSHE